MFNKNKITIIKPDDMHLHIRDNEIMEDVIGFTIEKFARAIIMPNLSTPITTVREAENYYNRIMNAISKYNKNSNKKINFKPLMTLYLNKNTTISTIKEAKKNDLIYAIKLYPQGATTNSNYGVKNIESFYKIFEEMQKQNLPLLIHGEVIDNKIDIFDKEKIFIESSLTKIISKFPNLKIVLEHLSTECAVNFVKKSSNYIAGTITPHHLYWNRNVLFYYASKNNKNSKTNNEFSGMRPHHYCLPLLKKENDRLALIEAATSGSEKFFLGTDSAPHFINKKEASCVCAGIFNSPLALELYTEIFEKEGKLNNLEKFRV